MALDTTIAGASSDSYGTLAAWETYAASKGWVTAGTDAVKEAYLRQAVDYLDRQYSWKGARTITTQALMWPRDVSDIINDFTVPNTTIPQAIINAQFEMAWLIHEGATPFATIANGAVLSEKVKAGPVESATTYKGRETARYMAVEGLVAPYMRGNGLSVPLVRA